MAHLQASFHTREVWLAIEFVIDFFIFWHLCTRKRSFFFPLGKKFTLQCHSRVQTDFHTSSPGILISYFFKSFCPCYFKFQEVSLFRFLVVFTTMFHFFIRNIKKHNKQLHILMKEQYNSNQNFKGFISVTFTQDFETSYMEKQVGIIDLLFEIVQFQDHFSSNFEQLKRQVISNRLMYYFCLHYSYIIYIYICICILWYVLRNINLNIILHNISTI